MAALVKKKQIRNGHRSHIKRLVGDVENFKEDIVRLKGVQNNIMNQFATVKTLDQEILDSLSEEGLIETEMEDSAVFSDMYYDTIAKVEHLMISKQEDTVSVTSSRTERKLRLPKIELKKFDGPVTILNWRGFWDQFDSAVNDSDDLSNIDKFNYLRSFLTGSALKVIEGLSLTKDNYEHAIALLKERFGNTQILISSHMEVLVKLPKVNNINDVSRLRNIYDRLEPSVRNLRELGIETDTYGSLLISIIFDRIPEELRIIISRQFKDNNWDLDSLIRIFKEELFARERCSALSSEKGFHSNDRSFDEKPYTLFVDTVKVCVYCGNKDHNSTRCSKISDVNLRKQHFKKTGRCFVCLSKGHVSRDCKVNYSCVKCKQRHNVSICSQRSRDYEKNLNLNRKTPGDENYSTMHVNSNNKSILLQTATAKVLNTQEDSYVENCRLLFDGGSQRTYVINELKEKLKLRVLRTENVVMKRFASDEGVLKTLDVVQLCVKGNSKNVNIYVEALCIPFLCSPLQNQDVNYARKNYPFIKDLFLAESARTSDGEMPIDILVGLDYYYSFITGRTRRGAAGGPVALESNLGWILCGPLNKQRGIKNPNVSNYLNSTHVMRLDTEILDDKNDLKIQLEKFWEIESLGINDTDNVYEKFREEIYFDGDRYVTNLPFKPHHEFLSDNFGVSRNRLFNLKKKLDKHPELLNEYNNIIVNYENEGIVERVEFEDVG